jgi:hypothetical protein
MKPFYNDFAEVLAAAAQSLVGGLAIWLVTVTVAGAIPTAVAADRLDEMGWELALAWIGHLAVAGMALWGLLIVCAHVYCLTALIHGIGSAPRAVVVAFVSQITTSTAVLLLIGSDHWSRLVATWGCFVILSTVYFVNDFFRQAREAKVSYMVRPPGHVWMGADSRPWRPTSHRW